MISRPLILFYLSASIILIKIILKWAWHCPKHFWKSPNIFHHNKLHISIVKTTFTINMTYLYSLFFFERSSPFLFSNSFSEIPNTCLLSMLIWITDYDFIMLSLYNLVFFISLDNCSLASYKIISALLISFLVFAKSF